MATSVYSCMELILISTFSSSSNFGFIVRMENLTHKWIKNMMELYFLKAMVVSVSLISICVAI